MARITDGERVVHTRAGIQPQQYFNQLRAAGFFKRINAAAARPVYKRQLQHAASALISDLRRGRINEATKSNAALLGLRIYPE